MVTLQQAMNETARTNNGAITNFSSMDANVDLFFLAGASRNSDIIPTFSKAYAENPELALRIALWTRDVREGAGERDTFRQILSYVAEKNPKHLGQLVIKIPEIGRWDDMLQFLEGGYALGVADFIFKALSKGDGLCAKWMPRKGPIAGKLRKLLGLTPKAYRKLIVGLSNTVEQKVCAKKWSEIEYGKLPSLAARKYQKTFYAHDEERYKAYIEGLDKGTEKINAGAIFPHDVISGMRKGIKAVGEAQWNALPDFLEGSKENILPVVDVSGSMDTSIGGNTTAMDVSLALGLYISERSRGIFRDSFITFSRDPKLETLKGSLSDRLMQLERAHWDMNTDFEKVFRVILKQAKLFKVPQSEMPTKLLVLSDMEFDEASRGNISNHDSIKQMYEDAGYEIPKIVYWNLNGRRGNTPVTVGENDTALVSGFSPSILKSILGGRDFNPVQIMLDTVMKDRYNLA